MIGARQVAFGRGGKRWVNPYITDGLIAMWDGEWNVSGGEHDETSATCVDLVEGLEFFEGTSEAMAFNVTGVTMYKNVDTSNDMTIEWMWRDVGNSRLCKIATVAKESIRYQIDDVSNTYGNYQIRYWNGTGQVTKYPMMKTIRAGALTYTDGNVCVYGDGVLKKTYSDAAASGSDGFTILAKSVFNCIRVYSRALTAEEIAHNYSIDKARFGL